MFFIFLLAAIPCFWVLQRSYKFQSFFQKKLVEVLEKEFKAKINVKSSFIDFFIGNIIFNNGVIKSIKNVSDKNFDWKFDQAKIKFSRLKLLFKKKINLDITFYNVKANSFFKENNITFIGHLHDIFESNNDIKVKLKSIKINNLDFNLNSLKEKEDAKNIFFKLPCFFCIEKVKTLVKNQNKWRGFLSIKSGNIFFEENNFLKNIQGKSFFYIDGDCIDKSIFKVNKEFDLLDKHFFLNCYKTKSENRFILKDQEKSPDIFFDANLNHDNIFSNFYFKNFLSDKLSTSLDLTGTASYNFVQKIGNLNLKNTKEIVLENFSQYSIKPENLFVNLKIDKDLIAKGNYKICVSDLKTETSDISNKVFTGICLFNRDFLALSGKILKGFYVLKFSPFPELCVKKILYCKNNCNLIDLKTANNSNELKGYIKYSFLKSFLPDNIKKSVFGKDVVFKVTLDQKNYNLLSGCIESYGGSFYIPGNYNPVKKISLNFLNNFAEKKFIFSDLNFDFFKGKISCPQATFFLDKDYKIEFAHMPVLIEDLLINWERNFYGFICGNFLLTQQLNEDDPLENHFKIKGDVILKKSLFKENKKFNKKNNNLNFFISDNPMKLGQNSIEFDINLINQNSIKINTSLLQADANIDLNLHVFYKDDKLQNPKLTGNIKTEKGNLKFLQHNLCLNYGKIQFIPNQMHDPIIDLVATNRIKKYLISLQATGSLQNPNVILESFPELSEEEILALLFAGNEDASLQGNLPNILFQNLNYFILQKDKILPDNKINALFKKFLMPFKYVQITPNFTDQPGYGGIKGTLSIDLNKQINAQIQKNFNLQEDFTFQVEYFLTDDINFKVMRDQRGELGSQVEVRLRL
ncbi:translocation/assembly module TamB [Candidatus Babeliales bacterium]|nr:translocation/assembly module TamB [Candidatus Babeliales bacterium]